MSNFVDRLKSLVDEHAGGKVTIFAKKAGIYPGTFDNYLKGRLPQAEQLLYIRQTYGVSIDWLLTGEGEPYRSNVVARTDYLETEQYLFVPLLQSWVKGGPEGRLIYEGIEDYLPFKRYYIEKLVGSSPERTRELYLVRVKGDSMAPTINDGETVLFDTNENERVEIRTGQIYLVQLPDGSVSVKRLSLSFDSLGAKLICHSDNVAGFRMFDFRLIPGRPVHSYVLGRVRWAGKEFD
jgi:phage repressor protein C with HTH and peptisase S24 domain